MRKSLLLHGTRWALCFFVISIGAEGCSSGSANSSDAGSNVDRLDTIADVRSADPADVTVDLPVAHDVTHEEFPEPPTDAPADVGGVDSDARAADGVGDPGDAEDADEDADADTNPADAPLCPCQSAMSLACFFSPQGPIFSGERPATDVGLADQICAGTFIPPSCVDNVEVFAYGDCGRTQIVVTGCFGRTEYIFDSNHQLIGASTASDTLRSCRTDIEAGAIGPVILGGETLGTSCTASSCSLVCRIKGGSQVPSCKNGRGDAADVIQDTSSPDAG